MKREAAEVSDGSERAAYSVGAGIVGVDGLGGILDYQQVVLAG